MPLKIIGAGFGRTGTMSVYTALNALGFPCYHMKEVFASKGHPAFWYRVASTPMELVGIFSATPVGVFEPSGKALDLPWRS
jgi:hypothetical protein